MQAFLNGISPGYLQTFGIPLLEGRDFEEGDAFDPRDLTKKLPTVAIVNRKFAEAFLWQTEPHRPAPRPWFRCGRHSPPQNIRIVGMVENSLVRRTRGAE